MSNLLFFLLLLVPNIGNTSGKEEICKQALYLAAKQASRYIDIFFASHDTHARSSLYLVNGDSYRTLRHLGTGKAIVYLAEDVLTGKRVIFKDYGGTGSYTKDMLPGLVTHEKMRTEFYRQNGFDVPEVLAIDVERGWLVKRYERAVPTDHLNYLFGEYSKTREEPSALTPEDISNLLKGRTLLIQQLLNLNGAEGKNFQDWLKRNYPQEFKILFVNGPFVFPNPDIRGLRDNFFFSFEKEAWLHHDP